MQSDSRSAARRRPAAARQGRPALPGRLRSPPPRSARLSHSCASGGCAAQTTTTAATVRAPARGGRRARTPRGGCAPACPPREGGGAGSRIAKQRWRRETAALRVAATASSGLTARAHGDAPRRDAQPAVVRHRRRPNGERAWLGTATAPHHHHQPLTPDSASVATKPNKNTGEEEHAESKSIPKRLLEQVGAAGEHTNRRRLVGPELPPGAGKGGRALTSPRQRPPPHRSAGPQRRAAGARDERPASSRRAEAKPAGQHGELSPWPLLRLHQLLPRC